MWIIECFYGDNVWYQSANPGCRALFSTQEEALAAIASYGAKTKKYRARQVDRPDLPQLPDKPGRPPVPHYARLSPEPIEVIDAWGWDKDYYRAQILRYLSRAGHKDNEAELKDLKKAADYLGRLIAKTEGRKGVWK